MPKRRLQTTLSDTAFRIIEKYRSKYGGMNEVIEEALKQMDSGLNRLSESDRLLMDLIRSLDFTACGKNQYLYLVLGDRKKAVEESMMETAVEWYLKKPLKEATLEEFLRTVERGWKALNRVDYIEITKGDNWIQWLCYHTMRHREVSEFLARHITYIYGKYFADEWDIVENITPNGFLLKFYRKNRKG